MRRREASDPEMYPIPQCLGVLCSQSRTLNLHPVSPVPFETFRHYMRALSLTPSVPFQRVLQVSPVAAPHPIAPRSLD